MTERQAQEFAEKVNKISAEIFYAALDLERNDPVRNRLLNARIKLDEALGLLGLRRMEDV